MQEHTLPHAPGPWVSRGPTFLGASAAPPSAPPPSSAARFFFFFFSPPASAGAAAATAAATAPFSSVAFFFFFFFSPPASSGAAAAGAAAAAPFSSPAFFFFFFFCEGRGRGVGGLDNGFQLLRRGREVQARLATAARVLRPLFVCALPTREKTRVAQLGNLRSRLRCSAASALGQSRSTTWVQDQVQAGGRGGARPHGLCSAQESPSPLLSLHALHHLSTIYPLLDTNQ